MAGTYTNLLYHLVFSTKNRQKTITPGIEEELYKYMGGIIRGIEGTCLEINGMPDHVHILAKLPPNKRFTGYQGQLFQMGERNEGWASQILLARWLFCLYREQIAARPWARAHG